MSFEELSEITGWKLSTIKHLISVGILSAPENVFSSQEIQRIKSDQFLKEFISYIFEKSPDVRIRMLSKLNLERLSSFSGSTKEKCWLFVNDLKEPQTRCPNCHKPAGLFISFNEGFKDACCSRSCARSYNYVNVSSRPEVKAKKRTTMIELYDATSPMTGSLKIKTQRTFIEKYGEKFPLMNKQFSAMVAKKRIDEVGQSIVIHPDWTLNESYEGHRRYSLTHNCGTSNQLYLPSPVYLCRRCDAVGRSSLENFISKNLGVEHTVGEHLRLSDGTKIFPDLRIGNLIVELDGNYWHSEERSVSKTKTSIRLKKLRDEQFLAMAFFEDEVVLKSEIVLSMIKAKAKVFERTIQGRKCSIEFISKKDAKIFLNENHIQGAANGESFGLIFESELVGIVTYSKSRFSKKAKYELLRLAFKRNVAIAGGAERLIKELKRRVKEPIISYSDNRFGEGAVYSRLGQKVGTSAPSYFYVNKSNYLVRLNRMKFQKHKLEKVLSNFDKEKSEWENMKLNGYDRIWDCGTTSWLL